jgi:hypothetical protein
MSSTSMFLSVTAFIVSGALNDGLAFLLLVVLLRLLVRVVWLADLLVVAIFWVSAASALDYSDPLHFIVTFGGYLLFGLSSLFVMRRFGLLALMAFFLANYIFVGTSPGVPFNSWFRGGWIGVGLGVAIPAWALWTILSAEQRRAGGLSGTEMG